MLDFCFEFWLSFCYFFVENGKEKFDMVVKNLLFLDQEFIGKVNCCLVGLGQQKKLSLINFCYFWGIDKFNFEKYEEVIIDFGYVISLNFKFVDGYYW